MLTEKGDTFLWSGTCQCNKLLPQRGRFTTVLVRWRTQTPNEYLFHKSTMFDPMALENDCSCNKTDGLEDYDSFLLDNKLSF